MASFNEYHLDPKQFTFLKSFQDNWQVIRDEFTHFIKHASNEELKFTYDIMGRVRASQSRLTKGTQHSNHIVIIHSCSLTFLSQTTSVS